MFPSRKVIRSELLAWFFNRTRREVAKWWCHIALRHIMSFHLNIMHFDVLLTEKRVALCAKDRDPPRAVLCEPIGFHLRGLDRILLLLIAESITGSIWENSLGCLLSCLTRRRGIPLSLLIRTNALRRHYSRMHFSQGATGCRVGEKSLHWSFAVLSSSERKWLSHT